MPRLFALFFAFVSLPLIAEDNVERGAYLVNLLSCAACHTEGMMTGNPKADLYLAGSSIGIGYSNDEFPGVVFPANITPDPDTGIGGWSREQVIRNIQYGIDRHGRQQLPIMPWPGYAHMTEADASAIADYLLSLPPVKNKVPAGVPAGNPTELPYVRFGVYLQSRAGANRVSPLPDVE
jgi:mono/diheme cytochrome c family protein